ncbi:MAG: ATP-binding protein, partial [Planctomycetaceae bacterium]
MSQIPENRATGQLQIGDQWNAINIIAQSQTHPLKAVCELTENAIDAGGRRVEIVRRRNKQGTFLEVIDDGRGLKRDSTGRPDFANITTHICDSMKRRLKADEKRGVHGEYGIGLLSFWSLGDELRMTTSGQDSGWTMVLRRNDPEYRVMRAGRLHDQGTAIVVGPLLEATRHIITGEKLQRYLAAELRDRIRQTGVEIHISDRVARKNYVVEPREFGGEPLALPKEVDTPFGPIEVEIYLNGHTGGGSELTLCKDGTRVLANLRELVQFDVAPWNDRRLEGAIDYRALNLAPGTRNGVVPDERLSALEEGLSTIDSLLREAISRHEEATAEQASRKLIRQVHKAFLTALQELPPSEYLYFDVPRVQVKEEEPELVGAERLSMSSVARRGGKAPTDGRPRLFPKKAGPLAEISLSPADMRKAPGKPCRIKAIGLDVDGTPVTEPVEVLWKKLGGVAKLSGKNTAELNLNSESEGIVKLRVTMTQKSREVTREIQVRFVEGAGRKVPRTLPSYR